MHSHQSHGLTVRPLSLDDLSAVAEVHLAAFPDTVASRLGRDAARWQYHSLMTGAYATTGLGAFAGSRLIGFCFVGVRHASERVFMRHHAPFLAWRLLSRPWLLADSVIWRRLVSALHMLSPQCPKSVMVASGDHPSNSPCPAQSFGLHYLAVDRKYRGRGIGRALLTVGEAHAKAQGIESINLSVETENIAAINLYLRTGWQKSSPSGVWLGLMTKRLTDD